MQALRFFLQGAHAAPLHPRRCHRHFGTFGLHALYGVWLARLMWRNPSPRFRLLWRKPGFVLRHDCRIRGMFPPEPPRSSVTLRRFLGQQSANSLQADCSHKTPKNSHSLPQGCKSRSLSSSRIALPQTAGIFWLFSKKIQNFFYPL